MKKIILGAAVFSISIGFFANLMAAVAPMPKVAAVPVPIQASAWSFNAELLYFQPTTSNGLKYSNILIYDALTGSTYYTNAGIDDPDHHFGVSLGAAYHIANTNNDIALQYTHLNINDSNFITKRESPGMPEPLHIHITGKADFDYDAVDLMFRHRINVDRRLVLHAAAGLRYACIYSDIVGLITTRFFDRSEYYTDNYKTTSNFSGIGPRLTFDGNYDLTHGFGIIARMGGSLLGGSIDSKFSQSIDLWNGSSWKHIRDYSIKNKSRAHVVPEVDAHLGVNYAHHFANSSSVIVNIGWRIIHYFNVIEEVTLASEPSNDDILKPQDLSFSGPFLGVTYSL